MKNTEKEQCLYHFFSYLLHTKLKRKLYNKNFLFHYTQVYLTEIYKDTEVNWFDC